MGLAILYLEVTNSDGVLNDTSNQRSSSSWRDGDVTTRTHRIWSSSVP